MKIPKSLRTALLTAAVFATFNLTGCASTNVVTVTNNFGEITRITKIDLPKRAPKPPHTNEVTLYVCEECGHQFTWSNTNEPPRCILHDVPPCPQPKAAAPAAANPPPPALAPASAPQNLPVPLPRDHRRHRVDDGDRPIIIQVLPHHYYFSAGTNSSSYMNYSYTE